MSFFNLSKLMKLKSFLFSLYVYFLLWTKPPFSELFHLRSWLHCLINILAEGSQTIPHLTAACLVWVYSLLSLVLFINPSLPHRPYSLVHFNWYQRDQHLKRPMGPTPSLIPVFSTANRLWLTCSSHSSQHLFLQVRTGLWVLWV